MLARRCPRAACARPPRGEGRIGSGARLLGCHVGCSRYSLGEDFTSSREVGLLGGCRVAKGWHRELRRWWRLSCSLRHVKWQRWRRSRPSCSLRSHLLCTLAQCAPSAQPLRMWWARSSHVVLRPERRLLACLWAEHLNYETKGLIVETCIDNNKTQLKTCFQVESKSMAVVELPR